MARLPSQNWLIQQIGNEVVLFEEYTEVEIVRFDPTDGNETVRAQYSIDREMELTPEDKCFAHFWSGYFCANALRKR